LVNVLTNKLNDFLFNIILLLLIIMTQFDSRLEEIQKGEILNEMEIVNMTENRYRRRSYHFAHEVTIAMNSK